MSRIVRLAALLAAFAAAAAWAQAPNRTSPIPEDAWRGVMTHVSQNVVTVNGQSMQLAPGARIWTRDNLTITPSMLPAGSLVDYTLDANRHVSRVWILTAAEAAKPRRGYNSGEPGTPIELLFGQPSVPPAAAPMPRRP